jgi:predicted nucleotidyltransferase component of viral defense system
MTMRTEELQRIAMEQGIDLSTLEHEIREVHFLENIAQDPVLALHLAFKGGTALRLVYGGDRYSDDLDFDLVRNEASTEEIFDRIRSIASSLDLEEKDAALKRNTILINTRERSGQRSLKIEVALKNVMVEGAVMKNIVTPLYASSVNVLTYPLPILFSGKILAVLYRKDKTPRDLYDLFWFLSHKVKEDDAHLRVLGEEKTGVALYTSLLKTIDSYDDKRIASELCAMLPRGQRIWVRDNLKERVVEFFRLRKKEKQ